MLNNLLTKYHFTSRIVFGVVLFALALISTGIIEGIFQYKKYFPFTGMILLLLATWVLYKVDYQNLNQLGLNFSSRNYKFILLGLFISLFTYCIATLLKNLITGQSIEFNHSFDYKLALIGIFYLIPNVVVEELLYRGYLFKKVVNKSSVIIANIVFSMLFMLVHVLDSQVLSSLGSTILMAVTIPVGHLFFAVALLKSKTILFPIGLHLGNNIANMHILTSPQKDQSLLYSAGPGTFETWPSFIAFLVIWNGFYLLVTYLIWKWPENYSSRLKSLQ